MLSLCFTPPSPLLMYVTAVILLHYTNRLVEESEGLRRDGAWEHGVLQQRAAGEAPLHDPRHVSLLMHVGAPQARTCLQERQRVSTAKQVRDACDMMAAYVYYPT